MSKSKTKIIVIAVVCSFLILIVLPVTIAGAVISHPLSFVGEMLFGGGDTEKMSDKDLKELYSSFLGTEIGDKTLKCIINLDSNDEEDRERYYENVWFIFPVLLAVNNADDSSTFESLDIENLINIAYKLRYANENDDNYITELKKERRFSEMSKLSNTTIISYISCLKSSSTADGIEITGDSEVGKAIVKSALTKLGCKYVWGAEGPNEFDCSGLVYWACKENNVNFTRTTAAELSKMGKSVEREELQAGDIITFKTDPTYVSHVGIYIGNGKMVHAPNSQSVVRVNAVFTSSYFNKVIYNYRRLY